MWLPGSTYCALLMVILNACPFQKTLPYLGVYITLTIESHAHAAYNYRYYFKICILSSQLHHLHLKILFTGDISLSSRIISTVDSDRNGASPQLTLTCISTGGPTTTVTWTRDSDTVTEGTKTALDDPVTAQYTHILTVTEPTSFNGTYSCRVSNNKPSSASVIIRTTVILTGMLHMWLPQNTTLYK